MACEAVFGPAIDPEDGFFEVDRYFVLEAQLDESGRLHQLGVFSKHYFGDVHPEWDETEDVGEMTEAQYEDLLRGLDRIEPGDPLVERDERPVVVGTMLHRRDVYQHAVVVAGDVVDDTRPDDAPRAVKYFIVVYPHESGEAPGGEPEGGLPRGEPSSDPRGRRAAPQSPSK